MSSTGQTTAQSVVEIFGEVAEGPVALALDATRARLVSELETKLELAAAPRAFALLDGACALELAVRLRRSGCRMYTLFEGPLAMQEGRAGPILAQLPADPTRALALCATDMGEHKGVLLSTYADLVSLVEHLRDIFLVTNADGREYFFRFYDPRVLRAFAPTCNVGELRAFLGPIRALVAENLAADGFDSWSAATRPGAAALPGAPRGRAS